jgi:type II secretory pathway predicted ATPase ExeA
MFEGYFGFAENPFNLTPDPKFLYLSEVHREALSHLQYGIEQRKGFILISGEVGTGKTTICRSLMAMLPRSTRTALVLNPSLSDIELLQAINQDFGLDASPGSKKELLDSLYNFLIETFVNGENAVLIIDECQNLTPEVLEQIRLLSNLETEKEKLLQIVMIGQPELVKMLDAPGLRQINDRITLRYHIHPLTLNDTGCYLRHRLEVAGASRQDIFTWGAVRAVYRFSRGLPRRMNAVAERALLMTYLKGRQRVDWRTVTAAGRELRGNYGEGTARMKWLAPFAAVAVALSVLAILYWPTLFSKVAEYSAAPVVATDTAVPVNRGFPEGQQQTVMPVKTDYQVQRFEDALELLSLMPEGVQGPDILTVHPEPHKLKLLNRPAIASVENGYMILVYATDDFVRVVGRDKAVVEIPMKDFKAIYRWNVQIAYAREAEDQALNRGDTGPEVEKLQKILSQAGYTVERTGFYDIGTALAVEQLQEDFGLKKNGMAGQETMELLAMLEKGA